VPNVDGCAAVRGLAEESSSGDPALLFSLLVPVVSSVTADRNLVAQQTTRLSPD